MSHCRQRGILRLYRVRQGLDQLIQLYILAGFSSDELHHISSQIMTLHQNGKSGICCGRATVHSRIRVFVKLLSMCCSHPPSLFLFLLLFLAFLRHFYSAFSLLIVTHQVAFGSNSFSPVAPVTPVTIMDNPHGREIHYHLARALMHLNSTVGFLPFFEPAVDRDDHEADPYRHPSFTSPRQRQLHTFVPLPSRVGTAPSIPSLSSHGGIPTHMVLNPEPHLRRFSFRRGPHPIEEGRPASASVRMEPSISNTPAHHPDRDSHIPSHDTELGRPKSKESRTEDARPKKKQRTMGISATSTPATTTPALPVIRDIPPEGPSSDESEETIYRGHSSSAPRAASPTPANPSAPVVNLPRGPPAEERPVPVFAKSWSNFHTSREPSPPSEINCQPPLPSLDGCRRSRTCHVQK